MIIDYNTINRLAADLDDRVMRNQLIASNVANVDTPGYTGKDVKFERILADTMDGMNLKLTHPKHMDDGPSGILQNEVIDNPNPGRPDGNNVNIDDEMMKLTENNMQFNATVQLITKKLRGLQDVIATK